jgi:membrane-bound metal-dependent hydrolase YbcI (DUF457 family)
VQKRSGPIADRAWRHLTGFALLGILPDVDLLVGAHSGPTHSLGAALALGAAVWALARSRSPDPMRTGLAAAAAYGSHVLLDWLGTDTAPPIGIMAMWPLTRAYFDSQLHVFPAVSRRIWQPQLFWIPNLHALVVELALLAPVVWLVGRVRGRWQALRTVRR